MSYAAVIGFEVHIELNTESKMFCGCPADHFGRTPNSQTCPVCLGLPGALPVPNSKAIEWCIKLGLTLNCSVNTQSRFDRKNYFYPDLPKGYQISQYDQPFCYKGWLDLSSGRRIGITRVHMEEDTGKLVHAEIDAKKVTLVDFNRSGVPLVEIVTEPDFTNMEDALEFLKEIQLVVRTLKISSGDMEKGSMRLEANVSVRPADQKTLPDYKVEIKNVNSYRFIKKAVGFEIERQTKILESGQTPKQETRGFNEQTGQTFSQRSKEEAHDYRYFPEPDIPPFKFTSARIDSWRRQLPELPYQKRLILSTKYHLNDNYVHIICSDENMYKLFIRTVKIQPSDSKIIADYLVNKKYGSVLPGSPRDIITALSADSPQVTSSAINDTAGRIIRENPGAVSDFKSGKSQALFFLIGRVKKELGPVDTKLTKSILEELLLKSDK